MSNGTGITFNWSGSDLADTYANGNTFSVGEKGNLLPTSYAEAYGGTGVLAAWTSSLDAKLKSIREDLQRRRHLPLPEQGAWLNAVVRGYFAYHAVPTNLGRLMRFRTQVTRSWHPSLRRRSQRSAMTWPRMTKLANRWLPPPRALHPYPWDRFNDRTRGRSRVR